MQSSRIDAADQADTLIHTEARADGDPIGSRKTSKCHLKCMSKDIYSIVFYAQISTLNVLYYIIYIIYIIVYICI